MTAALAAAADAVAHAGAAQVQQAVVARLRQDPHFVEHHAAGAGLVICWLWRAGVRVSFERLLAAACAGGAAEGTGDRWSLCRRGGAHDEGLVRAAEVLVHLRTGVRRVSSKHVWHTTCPHSGVSLSETSDMAPDQCPYVPLL